TPSHSLTAGCLFFDEDDVYTEYLDTESFHISQASEKEGVEWRAAIQSTSPSYQLDEVCVEISIRNRYCNEGLSFCLDLDETDNEYSHVEYFCLQCVYTIP